MGRVRKEQVEMSGNKNGNSKKTVKIIAILVALVAAFGMGMLAYHEFQRNILEPVKLVVRKDKTPVSENDGAPETEMVPEAGGEAEATFIGEDAAKEAAFAHAGVEESDTTYLDCHVDYDDGRAKCYDVDFVAGDTEYEYEIDLYTGSVIKSSVEAKEGRGLEEKGAEPERSKSESGTDNAAATYIGEEAAWEAALNHAQVAESDITQREIELDEEKGKMVYEIEFKVGRKEYDYEIDAVSGEILKAEEELD